MAAQARPVPAERSAAAPPPGADFRDEARQFVIFHLQEEMFAVALSEVQEIIRMPEIVRVPLSPPALEGLANLRGTVLPVVNLRDTFGFAQVLHDDATRVVVLDQGHPIGLVVDRMANVVTVDADRIERADTIRATVDTDLLTGMIKGRDGDSMVMILDAGRLVSREFEDIGGRAGSGGSEAAQVHRDRAEAVEATVDEDQLVSFEVAAQEYAFPIDQVQEIVQLPDRITHVPNTRSHVLGVITLRNRLLPLVSLREMFGLPAVELTEANKVVVVSLGDGATSVGVVMDSVKEVLRVGRDLVEPVPAMLGGGAQGGGELKSICRLEDGRRLVSILSAERMFNASEMRAVVSDAGGADMDGDGRIDRAGDLDDEEQFVVFRLMDEEYGVSIEAVQEIVRVPDELTRIPRTPAFIEGVINLRGVVLPVIDQRRRFGLAAAERNDRQRIMVFTIHGVQTGFIVDQVSEVMRIPAAAVRPAPDLSDEQKRMIRRVANLERQKRMILLLDVTQLLDLDEAGRMGTRH